jgi:hypothetical protein
VEKAKKEPYQAEAAEHYEVVKWYVKFKLERKCFKRNNCYKSIINVLIRIEM